MERAIVIFPDNVKLSEFLAKSKLSHAEAHSKHHSLIAPLSSEEIKFACKNFNALQVSFHHYQKTFKQILQKFSWVYQFLFDGSFGILAHYYIKRFHPNE